VLNTLDYGDSPTLCGIQSDEVPASTPTVDVEQYGSVAIELTDDPTSVSNLVCVLGTIHPKYTGAGVLDGYGFIYNTFKNDQITIVNGEDRANSSLKTNTSIFEYLVEKVILGADKVLNEKQLVSRFNLADLPDKEAARKNIGLSKVSNHRQLIYEENLRDLTNVPLARQHLGLGSSATKHVGYESGDVAPGNVVPIGAIVMWAQSTVPDGWVVCDGNNGTPNLTGKFVVGQDPATGIFDTLGNSGGGIDRTLVANNIPPHTHPLRQGEVASGAGGDVIIPAGVGTTYDTEENNGGTAAESFSIVPPYYVLYYIMYKGGVILPPEPLPEPAAVGYPNFSTPDDYSDGGYSGFVEVTVGGGDGTTVGSGITITNPQ